MKKEISEKNLKTLISILLVICAVVWCGFIYMVASTQPSESDLQSKDLTEETVYDTVVEDTKMSSPPTYYQADERWGGLPYGDGNLSDSGCGLTCAAMFASYIENDEWITPITILNLVGNRCITAGVNDMGLFCQELDSLYTIEYSEQLWTFEDAEKYLQANWCLFAGMTGQVYDGGRSYDGHVIFIWKWDDEGIWIKDPKDPNLQGPISQEEFEAIDITYFYAVRDLNS